MEVEQTPSQLPFLTSPLDRFRRVSNNITKDLKNSGFRKFFESFRNEASIIDEFDPGVNAMALLCAVILTIPFQMMSAMGNNYLDWLLEEFATCKDKTTNDQYTFVKVFTVYRISLSVCIFSAICGMILCTFFFLFKRKNLIQYRDWRSKARTMVTIIFMFTCLSIFSLMLFTVFVVTYYFLGTNCLCEYSVKHYTVPAVILSCLVFFACIYYVW